MASHGARSLDAHACLDVLRHTCFRASTPSECEQQLVDAEKEHFIDGPITCANRCRGAEDGAASSTGDDAHGTERNRTEVRACVARRGSKQGERSRGTSSSSTGRGKGARVRTGPSPGCQWDVLRLDRISSSLFPPSFRINADHPELGRGGPGCAALDLSHSFGRNGCQWIGRKHRW